MLPGGDLFSARDLPDQAQPSLYKLAHDMLGPAGWRDGGATTSAAHPQPLFPAGCHSQSEQSAVHFDSQHHHPQWQGLQVCLPLPVGSTFTDCLHMLVCWLQYVGRWCSSCLPKTPLIRSASLLQMFPILVLKHLDSPGPMLCSPNSGTIVQRLCVSSSLALQTYKSTSASSPVLVEQGRGFSGDGSHSFGPQEAYTSPLNQARPGVPTPSSHYFDPSIYDLHTDQLPSFEVITLSHGPQPHHNCSKPSESLCTSSSFLSSCFAAHVCPDFRALFCFSCVWNISSLT